MVRTKLSEMLWKNDPDAKQKPTHLQRYADPIEMAGLAAFLTSFEASYLTGESIVIDGGSDAKL